MADFFFWKCLKFKNDLLLAQYVNLNIINNKNFT